MLYTPALCRFDLPAEFKSYHVAEEKVDGSRYILYIGDDIDPYGRQDSHTLLSRRISSVDNMHVDRTLQVPHITDQLYNVGLHGTVLDGEIFKDDFATTTSIIGSGHNLAIQKQENEGWLSYYAFDIMCFRGIDVRGKSLADRRKILEAVIERLNNPYIVTLPQYKCDFEKHFTEITAEGGEGLIVKDTRMGYGISWAKMKKAYEVTCIITGFTPGSGKYDGQVGAMQLSVLHDGEYCDICKASGFDDATRTEMTENPAKFVGRCVDINTMRLNKPNADHPLGRLFQPTFHRFRDDFNRVEATFEKMKADLKKKPKSNRNKWGS